SVQTTGSFFNRPFDIFIRNVVRFCFFNRRAQCWIRVWIASAFFCRLVNKFGMAHENFAAFRILCTFAALNIVPFRVSSHDKSPSIAYEIPLKYSKPQKKVKVTLSVNETVGGEIFPVKQQMRQHYLNVNRGGKFRLCSVLRCKRSMISRSFSGMAMPSK